MPTLNSPESPKTIFATVWRTTLAHLSQTESPKEMKLQLRYAALNLALWEDVLGVDPGAVPARWRERLAAAGATNGIEEAEAARCVHAGVIAAFETLAGVGAANE